MPAVMMLYGTELESLIRIFLGSNLDRNIVCSSWQQQIGVRGQLGKFVDWRQCAAVVQREAVIVMPSCSGGVT